MAVEITQDAIDKLTHTSDEIRLRALDHIESKFVRAIAHNLPINFKPTELCKQLIRCFKYQPQKNAGTKVLKLLKRMLDSSYGEEAIEYLGVARLKTELQKVRELLNGKQHELQILNEILKILLEREKRSVEHNESSSDLASSIDKLSLDTNENSKIDVLSYRHEEDYEIAWSRPITPDYNSLKTMVDMLANDSTQSEEKENILHYLQNTMPDYPAEYMLQSPHIFEKLLSLWGNEQEHDNGLRKEISAALLSFLRILRNRLCKRYKVDSHAAHKRPKSIAAQSQNGMLAKTQLKVSKAMELMLEKCLEQLSAQTVSVCQNVLLVMEIVSESLAIIKIQHLSIGSRFLVGTNRIRTQQQDILNREESHITLARTKHIWLTFILLEMADINSKRSQLADQYKLFAPQLIDFSLEINFPKLFDRIKKLMFTADSTVEESYAKMLISRAQFESAIQLLTQDRPEPSHIITQAVNILPTLDVLNSLNLTKVIFNAILEAIPLYPSDRKVKELATSVLHKLMQLQSSNLKAYVYRSIAKSIKKHFAALMNNENICTGIQNQYLLRALILGIPLNQDVLQQIVYDSYEGYSPELRKNAEGILVLLLKSHHFYEASCMNYLEFFSPLLPILQCCTHSRPIFEVLLKLLDPDSKLFPFIDILRNNIGLMFANESTVRSEALTRLIYMLNLVPQASDYLPNIPEVSDVLPNDLCIFQIPRDMRQIFVVNEVYYDRSSLLNLFKLLDTADIEPQVRKTTLLQLNVMCKDWQIVAAFCEEQAHCLVLSALENSLKKDTSADYIESAIPTISILAKLLLFDSGFRHELEKIPNIYILLLRAMFHFSQDVQLRHDTSICLFLLVFGKYVAIKRGGGKVEVSKLLSNLSIPLKFDSSSVCKEQSHFNVVPDNLRSLFSSEDDWKGYLRQVIANSYCKISKFSKKDLQEMHESLDICPTLLMEQREVRLLRATNSFLHMRTLIKTISNATDQKTAIKSITTIRLQLMIYYLECATLTQLPPEVANGLFSLLSKYLQVIPGNAADFQVYACVLDIFHLCVRLSSAPIIRQLKSMLRTDFYQSAIIMLRNPDLPLNVYIQLSEFVVALLDAATDEVHADKIFRANLFELVYGMMQQFFAARNLQRIRCLLRISKSLTSSHLELPEQFLHKCSKYFVVLSIHIKSTTQTGANWNRHCLLNFIQIFEQLPNSMKLRLSDNILNHMIGLCAHIDMEVRALAWICLSLFANVKIPSDINAVKRTKLIASNLSHLPGGFIGCCLCTFLDAHEVVLVRHFAGNLFVLFLKETCNFEKAILLLERHRYFATAYTSLETCIFDETFPLHSTFLKTPPEYTEDGSDIKFATCETVICYCRICIVLITLQPHFVLELCEKPLLFKLYELLKLPAVLPNERHYEMCTQICHLYALCSKDNFLFLQRTVCHDDRWLSCLFDLLDPPSNATEESIVYVLQLILALCCDDFVCHRLFIWLEKSTDILRKLLGRAINIKHIGSSLQRSTLGVVIYLLIKSQPENILEEGKFSFIIALEKEFNLTQGAAEKAHNSSLAEANKENICGMKNVKSTKQNCRNELVNTKAIKTISLSEIILQDLYKIFIHLYPCNCSKFDIQPGATRTQICEAISLLLKVSSHARLAAHNLKFLSKILLILENFFQQFGNNGATFIKRHGESKKLAIIENLKILFQILLHWFSPTAGVLIDELQCFDISKIILQSWPWLSHSLELRSLVLHVCSFLSERSLMVCSQFSTMISSYASSILQLVIKIVIAETRRVTTTSAMHLSTVAVGLRVMMNCCACTEGRLALVKEHALDVIDGLHPFNAKSPKIRKELLHHWLQFWELFSRYGEGGKVRNLNALCKIINQYAPYSNTRLICLKILRNMCFVQQNRYVLMTSNDFIQAVNVVISQPTSNDTSDPASYEEQMIVSVAIWQLISGGVKFMAMIRGTNLASKLRILRERLQVLNEGDSTQFKQLPFATDLLDILEIIFDIFTEN